VRASPTSAPARAAIPAAALCIGALLGLAACNDRQALQAPPAAPVVVAKPVRQDVQPYATFTGQTAAYQTVDLVARVPGFLREVNFKDGSQVEADRLLFLIEPEPYQAQVDLAQATIDQHQAQLKAAEAEFERQQVLQSQAVSTQANYDKALANRDSERAAVAEGKANLVTAQINLGYTKVLAPFAGRIGRHLVDPGNLVGQGTPTKLATIDDIGKIYVYFTASESDVLRFRTALAEHGIPRSAVQTLTVEAGLQNEQGYPHAGRLDFVDTGLDTTTATLQVRAVFDNADQVLIPGLFARLRIPLGDRKPALLVPETALNVDQVGPFLLVVDKDQTVASRRVALGTLDGDLRVIADGLDGSEQVVIDGLQNATPGRKVTVREGAIRSASATP
jgi:membrane fusion protein, multidrug efflux system